MADQKEIEEVPDIKRRPIELALRCGECIFLTKFQTYAKPCSQYGTVPSSEVCQRFVADPAKLVPLSDVRKLLELMSSIRNPNALAASIASVRKVRKLGFELGQTVYFRVMGKDYLNNYATAMVLGVNGKAKLMVAGAQNFIASINGDQLLGREEWEAKRARLVSRNLINEPDGGLRKITLQGKNRLVAFEPPSLTQGKKKGPRSAFSGKKSTRKKGPIILSTGDTR
jgi:hypothetical protein